jgi:hypothetical protein
MGDMQYGYKAAEWQMQGQPEVTAVLLHTKLRYEAANVWNTGGPSATVTCR